MAAIWPDGEMIVDDQIETMRENEAFEGGVEAFMKYVSSNEDDHVEAAYEVWREWSKHHPMMSVDAQVEARRRWASSQ